MDRLFGWRWLGREEGQVLPLFAAALLPLVLMVGVVVDGGNLFQNKQSVHNAADVSALAAALEIANSSYACSSPAPPDPIGDCAGKYAGRNGVGGPTGNTTSLTAAALPTCASLNEGVSDTKPPRTPPGCYVSPYKGDANRVEVWLTRRTSNFFGKLFGRATSGESARAVASVVTTTTIIPGTITTTGGNPALLFAMCGYGSYTGPACAASGPPDSTCTALSLGGSNQTLNGAVVSNGGVQNGGNNDGPGPLYYNKAFGPSPGNGTCLTADAQWLSKIPEAPRDWPVALPTCTPGCSTTTQSNHLLVTSVTANGVTVPCTPMPVNNDNPQLHTGTGAVNSVKIGATTLTLSEGLYCATTSITFPDSLTLRGVGFVAPAINWAGGPTTMTGY
ncbi:MAG TPA: pilus assembly protein TadG-related protein, partial [Gaiellaceae bacterium]|nr:pilus assembly protein TadG-related protein [Gaiellaceae bacterium]